jgi:hypothetical protein
MELLKTLNEYLQIALGPKISIETRLTVGDYLYSGQFYNHSKLHSRNRASQNNRIPLERINEAMLGLRRSKEDNFLYRIVILIVKVRQEILFEYAFHRDHQVGQFVDHSNSTLLLCTKAPTVEWRNLSSLSTFVLEFLRKQLHARAFWMGHLL